MSFDGDETDLEVPEKIALAAKLSTNTAALADIVETSREKLNFLPAHFPRYIEYPWVLERIRSLPGARVAADIGAGISPLPIVLAEAGIQVDTFDASERIRNWSDRKGWNSWGYLDYGEKFENVRSFNAYFSADAAGAKYDVIYSVSVVEHTPKSERVKIWREAAKALAPGGRLIFTIDLVRNSTKIWNKNLGRIVEDPETHGDIAMVVQELDEAGFVQDYVEIVRGLPLAKVDLLFFSARRKTDSQESTRSSLPDEAGSEALEESQRMTDFFNRRYVDKPWPGGLAEGTRSGRGSTLKVTEGFRAFLAEVVSDYRIRSIFDAPCGDFHWMKEVPLPSDVRYIGGDIASVLVDELNEKYGDDSRRFVHFDIVNDTFPDADLWICRDCFFHIPLDFCIKALRNACAVDVKFAVLTSIYRPGPNRPGQVGGSRPIDLLKPPFNLPEPIAKCDELIGPRGRPQRFQGLWKIEDIRAALG